ncbi:hypothetical protein DICSQDRAFT_84388 [Dichomitus squalens LYAD-421 SS1]|uniref:uncharacterized protein n=1 Tax=Dichomitus squalens (strain LYAD-421) TaxID=732165 RepID=UPI0004412984|nr:uncharacterized protein DICSQDRAFT_84388 [Dichomitus squalens LYAD-421 SS1]EJF62578.1 hypothetical protein DICSQDRAFT_84388 [Dichomitus squalens LYAD-421 SS1]
MDNPGWHAFRRADKDEARWSMPHRGPDGRFQPVEEVGPMAEPFVGGFLPPPSPVPSLGRGPPPPLPPKDGNWDQLNVRLPSKASLSDTMSRTESTLSGANSTYSTFANMSAVERSKHLRVARMNPHLQYMVGPLLRYDTVDEQGVWRGAAMIVTADAGSVYEPLPTLTYHWDPDLTPSGSQLKRHVSSRTHGQSFDLGPHPADPMSIVTPGSPTRENETYGNGHDAHVERRRVEGKELYVYYGNGGQVSKSLVRYVQHLTWNGTHRTFTFWRFMIEIPLTSHEMRINYTINDGIELNFHVPGRNQNMRWAAYSCNGFSSGVNPDDFRGPGYKSGYDPVWMDLLAHHAEEPFHALVGGGDQLYCDSIVREPEMQDWVNQTKAENKRHYRLTEEMALAIDRFFFNHYCQSFRSGAFARANSTIEELVSVRSGSDTPLVKIDGFGSYPDDLMRSPVFNTIGSRGYFFFLLFQCFINVEVDGRDDRRHPFKSLVIGGDGPYIPYPSHSFLCYLGPHVYMLLLDCRAERKKDQVCSQREYEAVFARMKALPSTVEHMVIQTGIPIAYPRMVFLETALDSKFNPLVALGRNGSLGLSGFVNKFNADAELLDDLNDHWTAKAHKKERNWFILELQKYAKATHVRVSFISGDVHCAAVGLLKTFVKDKKRGDVPPPLDPRYMVNVVSSAIVNTPPPNGVISLVSTLASKTHRTLHHQETDETMIPLFERDTDGSAPKSRYIMGKRNWCSVKWDPSSGDLIWDIRVEISKGNGQTTGYAVRSPPPRW